MNRELLNQVRFDTPYIKIEMKPRKISEAPSNPVLKRKLARVLFFWVLVAASLFVGKLGIEYGFSVSRGVPHMSLQEIINEFQER